MSKYKQNCFVLVTKDLVEKCLTRIVNIYVLLKVRFGGDNITLPIYSSKIKKKNAFWKYIGIITIFFIISTHFLQGSRKLLIMKIK